MKHRIQTLILCKFLNTVNVYYLAVYSFYPFIVFFNFYWWRAASTRIFSKLRVLYLTTDIRYFVVKHTIQLTGKRNFVTIFLQIQRLKSVSLVKINHKHVIRGTWFISCTYFQTSWIRVELCQSLHICVWRKNSLKNFVNNEFKVFSTLYTKLLFVIEFHVQTDSEKDTVSHKSPLLTTFKLIKD